MKKIIKRTVTVIISIFLAIIVFYNAFNFVNIKILKKNVSPVFGYAMLEVVSGSMLPKIQVGDMIIIDTNSKNYEIGDIITYTDKNDALVTHRIISIEDEEIITKGDNNNSEDPAIDKEKIVGKYITKINNLGRILASFKNPVTMLLILIIGILACILVSVDEKGNPILEDEEKEFQEYLANKEKIDESDKTTMKASSKVASDKKAETPKKHKTSTSKKTNSNTTKKTNTSKAKTGANKNTKSKSTTAKSSKKSTSKTNRQSKVK